MTTLRIDVSEEVKTRLASRAAESGFATVEEYAQALLQAEARDEDLPPDVEQLLSDRMEDARPGIEFTQQFQDDFRRQVRDRRDGRGARR